MTILVGDALTMLRTLPDESVHCSVTSPPYFGLRDYGIEGQIGLETTPTFYVERLVAVFAEVRRVLRGDGTLWLVLGDSYANDGKWGGETGGKQAYLPDNDRRRVGREKRTTGLKPKDLIGIPWTVAFALRADGWWLRCDVVWGKPNPMPESVRDRPTKSHEYVFLLTKSEHYWYDADAIKEPVVYGDHPRNGAPGPPIQAPGQPAQSGITKRRRSGNKTRTYPGGDGQRPADHLGSGIPWEDLNGKRNARSVWWLSPDPCPEAHFATFPRELVRRCILAGCPPGGTVLDPFAGTGTTGRVAMDNGNHFIGIELNPKYAAMARRKLAQASLLVDAVAETATP